MAILELVAKALGELTLLPLEFDLNYVDIPKQKRNTKIKRKLLAKPRKNKNDDSFGTFEMIVFFFCIISVM